MQFGDVGLVATLLTSALLATSPAPAHRLARPPIVSWPIPFGAKRKREMAAYSERHYGQRTWRLRHPQVIVEHMSQTSSARAVYNTFAPDVPDVELHELPNVCSHFVIGSSGRIFRLVNLRTRCRHTVGLNWTAIGIEHVGYGDGDVLGDRRTLHASLRLTIALEAGASETRAAADELRRSAHPALPVTERVVAATH